MTGIGKKQRRMTERMRGRAFAGLTAGGLGLIVLCLSIAPVGASPIAKMTTMKAPYHGTVTPWSFTGSLACAKQVTVKPWNFNLKTGNGGWYGWASSKACNSGPSESYIDSGVDIAIAIAFHHSGLQVVKAHFVVSFNTTGSIASSGTCHTTMTKTSWGHQWTGAC